MRNYSPKLPLFLLAILSFQLSNAQLFGPENVLGQQASLDDVFDLQVLDLDDDGDVDLLTTGSDKSLVWRENLDGEIWRTHVLGTNLPQGKTFYGADLNGDGHMDVICSRKSSSTDASLLFLYNQGDNTFGTAQHFDSLPHIRDLICKDIDGDGYVEIFCAHNKRVIWYKGLGGGNFSSRKIITSIADKATELAVEDINGDGLLDVVSFSNNDNKLAWYENLGTGSFGAQQLISTYSSLFREMKVIDLDQDGDMDITICGSSISYYENLGGGLFNAPVELFTNPANPARSIAISDLDGDGDLDVFGSNPPFGAGLSGAILWMENVGGTYATAQLLNGLKRQGAGFAEHLEIADFNNDGFNDLLAWSGNNAFYIWENDGSGTFLEAPSVKLIDAVNDPVDGISSDLDGDGDIDFLFVNDENISWFVNYGDATFEEDARVVSLEPYDARAAYPADLDGDGDLDVLGAVDDQITWYENLGSKRFGQQQIISIDVDQAQDVFAIDLDGDGDFDVLSASFSDDKIAWYENLGGGNFGPQQVISSIADGASSVGAADLDADGDYDVLSTSISDDKLAWYENLGGGNFGPEIVVADNANLARDLSVADINNDGHLDIVSHSWGQDQILWYENLGGGNFDTQKVVADGVLGPRAVHTADLDNDGDADVLGTEWFGNTVAWYENLGAGSFGPKQVISNTFNGPPFVDAADFDNDGDLEILSASYYLELLGWFENLSPQNCTTPPVGLSSSYTNGSPDGTLDLSWQEIPAANFQIRIEKISSAVPKSKMFFSPTNSLSITAAFKPWHTFRWKVRAACPADTSEWSAYQLIDIPSMRSQQSNGNLSVTAVPNPAGEQVVISLNGLDFAVQQEISPEQDQAGKWMLRVVNTAGKLVHSSTFDYTADGVSLDLVEWPAGLYFFSIENSNKGANGLFYKE